MDSCGPRSCRWTVRRSNCIASLTMSIMSFLPGGEGVGLPEIEGMKMGINLGWNKVRFMHQLQWVLKFEQSGN